MKISEDWWAVIASFLLIAAGWINLLGKAKGIINIPW
jgi:hypothetical protein